MPAAVNDGTQVGVECGATAPTTVVASSTDVMVNSKGAVVVGDSIQPHAHPLSPPHPGTVAKGSSTVFVNGKPMAQSGGNISCGAIIASAVTNVNVN